MYILWWDSIFIIFLSSWGILYYTLLISMVTKLSRLPSDRFLFYPSRPNFTIFWISFNTFCVCVCRLLDIMSFLLHMQSTIALYLMDCETSNAEGTWKIRFRAVISNIEQKCIILHVLKKITECMYIYHILLNLMTYRII